MAKRADGERIVFGRVVAEREYRAGRAKVVVQIGTPHRASWKTDFYCPFRIVRGRRVELRRVYGVDAFQALMLAFDFIKAQLESSLPDLTWPGGERPGDVGISRRLPSLGLDFERELERLVDRAVLKRGRALERQHRRRAAD